MVGITGIMLYVCMPIGQKGILKYLNFRNLFENLEINTIFAQVKNDENYCQENTCPVLYGPPGCKNRIGGMAPEDGGSTMGELCTG